MTALEIIKAEPERRKRLKENADYLHERLGKIGLNTGRSLSHIIPVIIGSEENALTVSQELYKRGFFVVAIRPPTVPKGTARLRISVQSEHSRGQIDKLCEAFEELIRQDLLPLVNDLT
jgi:7-keto-8-aminopelargonate synthetase-like enzyme